MKKRDFEKKLKKQGWALSRHGSNHDVWTNGVISGPVPRHSEIDELLAKKICAKSYLKPWINGVMIWNLMGSLKKPQREGSGLLKLQLLSL